jgi:hypothetical protein
MSPSPSGSRGLLCVMVPGCFRTLSLRWGPGARVGHVAGALAVALGCSAPARPGNAPARGAHEGAADAEYSLTQKSSSAPERQGDASSTAPAPAARQNAVEQGCGAEYCVGSITPSAIAELSATAARAQECYERELTGNAGLEGKLTLLIRLPGLSALETEACPARIEGKGLAASETFKTCLIELFRSTKARGTDGCADVALPLAFVRKEIEAPSASPGETTGTTPGKTNAPSPGKATQPAEKVPASRR